MRTRTAALFSILATILLLGVAASASAESPGLDQYVETIPGAGGNHVTEGGNHKNDGGDKSDDSGGSGGGSPSGPTVDSSQLDALRSQGKAGERAAAALEATSNVRDDDKSGSGDGTDARPAGHDSLPLDSSEADGKAPVEAILSSMFGGSGIALPLIMLAVLVGGLVIAARTRAGSIDD